MALWHRISPDRRSVAIIALKRRRFCRERRFALARLLDQFITVTRYAREHRHVGVLHLCDIVVLRYSHVTCHAILHVNQIAALVLVHVIELERISTAHIRVRIASRQRVATRTVVCGRFDAGVVALKARRVAARHILEECCHGRKAIGQGAGERGERFVLWRQRFKLWQFRARLVTDGAVVELRWFVIGIHRKTRVYKMRDGDRLMLPVTCDDVLMTPMRKLC